MPSNKDRLYVALYARGGDSTMPNGEDKYHWALLIGPKTEAEGGMGTRYHAKERLTQTGEAEWYYEERDTSLTPTSMLLVRVMIGKVKDRDRLVNVLRNNPIRQGNSGWNCVMWIKEALEGLKVDGKALGTSVTEWNQVRDGAMTYCQRKKDQHRFDGQGDFDMNKTPTYDLMDDRETIP